MRSIPQDGPIVLHMFYLEYERYMTLSKSQYEVDHFVLENVLFRDGMGLDGWNGMG